MSPKSIALLGGSPLQSDMSRNLKNFKDFEVLKEIFLQDKIINSSSYNSLRHETWNQGRISNYLTKSIANNSILDEMSTGRIIFIINVLNWHMRKNVYSQSIFVINKRPWFSVYNEYAAKYNKHHGHHDQ